MVTALSWTARELQHQKIPVPDRDTWITSDLDSLYHMRRLERMLDEGGLLPAGSDPYLSYPAGSPIPWPPYYAPVTRLLAGPAPDGPARHDWIERRIASLPRLFGVLTSILAALAAYRLAGPAAGLVAGGIHALAPAAVVYGRVGNGDHHAWITLLAGGMLWLTAEAVRGGGEPRRAAGLGLAAGTLAGLALGAWVASLLHVIPVQLVLGWLLVRARRRPVPALVPFGLAFHAAALVVVLPAAAASPWNARSPWDVVNLSWFHPVFLAAGALVIAPRALVREGTATRAYPWVAAGGLAVVALALIATGVGPGAGIREAFAWMGREDEFMGAVWESRGLLGAGAAFDPVATLGLGLFLLPFAGAAAAWQAFRRDRLELLPWVVAALLLLAQAARQVRFAEALVLPMGVVIGWSVGALWRSRRGQSRTNPLLRWPSPARGTLIVGLLCLAHWPTVAGTVRALERPADAPGQPERPGGLAVREACDWIRTATTPGDWSVLASWTWGHAIEWGAGRPSVATNFGTFVGEDSFRDPSRFFLAEEAADAEAILGERRSRFVLLTTYLPNQVRQMIRSAAPEQASRWVEPGGPLRLRFGWYRTMGARLLHDGGLLRSDGSLGPSVDFVRLVYTTALTEQRMRPEPGPVGLVWEWVPGATLEAEVAPGDTLDVALAMRYPRSGTALEWRRSAVAAADGVARVRVPYSTEGPNGEGMPAGPARWRIRGSGPAEGEVAIPERAVRERGVLRLAR